MENTTTKTYETIKVRGGRTGTKIHFAVLHHEAGQVYGGTTTHCGIWLRGDVIWFRVADSSKVTCEKCNPLYAEVSMVECDICRGPCGLRRDNGEDWCDECWAKDGDVPIFGS